MVENALVLEKEIRALVEKYNSLKEDNLDLKTKLEQKTSELDLFIEEQELLKKENDELRLNVKSVEGIESEYRSLLSSLKNIISAADLSDASSKPVIDNDDNSNNKEIYNEEHSDKITSGAEDKFKSIDEVESYIEATSTDNANENNSQFECNNNSCEIQISNEVKEDDKIEIRQSKDDDIITINDNEDPFSKASDSDWDSEIAEPNNINNNNGEVVSSHDDEYIFSDDDDEDLFFGEEDEKSV